MKVRLFLRRLVPVLLRKPVSTIDALARIVSLNDIEQVILQTADRRSLLCEMARRLSHSEQLLLGQVSTVMGLGMVTSVPPLASDVKIDVGKYREAGAVPLVHNKMTTGVVCVDPELFLAHFPEQNDSTFFLGMWSDISTALDETEREYNKKSKPICIDGSASESMPLGSPEVSDSLIIKVLDFIKDEATKHNSRSIKIVNENDESFYCFETQTGASAKGKISSKIWSKLARTLENRADLLAHVWKLQEELKVVQLGPELFVIEWTNFTEASDRGLKLHAVKPTRQAINSSKAKVGESDSEIYSVLLVEDNQTFARVLERFFTRQNIIADFAENGREALELLEGGKIRPDLIICDVHMPQMNGFEFVKLIKGNEDYQDIPVIMLTSDDDVETELRVLGDGADAFLAKSEDPRLLGVYVRKLINKATRLRALREAA